MEVLLELILLMLQPCLLFLHTEAAGHHGGVHLRSQREALLEWKSTLQTSPALDSWRPATSPCSSNWTGIMCSVVHHGHLAPQVVTEISLPNAAIDGQLGNLNFSALPFLTYIDFSYNSLRGKIPLAITSLPVLSYLDLTGNWLHGQIPSEFGNMARLTQLGLMANNLTGHIPASLGNLTTTLVALITQQNMLTGPIPEELGKLIRLEVLDLGSNLLMGQIPENLSSLTKLTILYLYDNQLSGPIPSSLGNLYKLTVLQLDTNRLSGGIQSLWETLLSSMNFHLL